MPEDQNIKSKIESLLFVSAKPLSINKLADLINEDKKEVNANLAELTNEYKEQKGGMQIMKIGQKYQMVSEADNAKVVRDYLKDEQTGELTKPALETLTIVTYRGPITKAELELIRGVNCSLILRNLMIKGLVEAKEDKKKMLTTYQITFDFLKYLGLNDIQELPDYEQLNSSEMLKDLLQRETTEEEEVAERAQGDHGSGVKED